MQELDPREAKRARNLAKIKDAVVVLSGKGGVGKSTVAVNLALALSLEGRRTGLLDVDLHGPSTPRMLALEKEIAQAEPGLITPHPYSRNLWVLSTGLLVKDPEQALIWRGPIKQGVIEQLLHDGLWGELDHLIVDTPPGTGDEHLAICNALAGKVRAIVVTGPRLVAVDDARRSIGFCREMNIPLVGVLENMGEGACPNCGHVFAADSGAGRLLAAESGVPFLGSVPADPEIARSGDLGIPYVKVFPDSPAAKLIRQTASFLAVSV